MTARHRLPDCPTFREMWMAKSNRNAIADRFGVTVVEVGDLARAYGYPARSPNRLEPQGPLPARRPAADPPRLTRVLPSDEKRLPVAKAKALAGDRWSPDQVVAVFRTQGRYSELTALADAWGVKIVALVGLWHRVRVTG